MKKFTALSSFVFLIVCCFISIDAYSQSGMTGSWSVASNDGFIPNYWYATSVVNDKIYIIGGGNLPKDVQTYDPASDEWTTLTTTGTFTPRFSLTSCVLDGKIYVMGGATGPEQPSTMSNKLEIFDPATNTWTTPKTTGTFTKRNNLCSGVIGGKIYTFGGYDAGAKGDLNVLEVFDPSTNTWSTPKTTGTFTPRGAFSGQVINDKIYVVGGYDNGTLVKTVQVFDPATNVWSTPKTTGTFTARLLFTTALLDGKIFVIGGTTDLQNPLTKNVVQVFDPATNAWSTPTTDGTFTPRFYLSSNSAAVNGSIYVIGGVVGQNIMNANEVFTPVIDAVKMGDASSTELTISPNPTTGIVHIQNASDNTHVIIENMLGKKMMELKNSEGPNFTLDFSNLPSGAYFARFIIGNNVVTKKIIKG